MKKQITEKELMVLIKNEEKILLNKRNYYRQTEKLLIDTIQTTESLKEIEKNKNKIFVRLGSGVMVEAEVSESKKVTRAFSEKAYFQEDIKDTQKWLNKRKKALENQVKKIREEIKKTEKQLKTFLAIAKKINEEKKKLSSKNIATK